MKKEDFLKHFGKHLREVRTQKGISLRELELRGEIDRQKISKIEQGKLNPTLYTVRKLAEILEIDFAELFKDFHS